MLEALQQQINTGQRSQVEEGAAKGDRLHCQTLASCPPAQLAQWDRSPLGVELLLWVSTMRQPKDRPLTGAGFLSPLCRGKEQGKRRLVVVFGLARRCRMSLNWQNKDLLNFISWDFHEVQTE